MRVRIALLPGDGIGPEVTAESVKILKAVEKKFGHHFQLSEGQIGGTALNTHEHPFPESTAKLCQDADAVLLGAVGGPVWDSMPTHLRPEKGLLELRKTLNVFANIRPISIFPELRERSPIRSERLKDVDFVFVRELTGGIYFGQKYRDDQEASDLCCYARNEIERVVDIAAKLSTQRSGHLMSIDKANVLETSRLWRETTTSLIEKQYSHISLRHMLVDAAAMHLISRPSDFDVIVTENMFGDILTDEASMLTGSIGMLPSASVNNERRGVYEPIHGSAPDLAGRNRANPCAAILSAAMLLRHSCQLEAEASLIESAVRKAITAGARTQDIASSTDPVLSTQQMGDAIVGHM